MGNEVNSPGSPSNEPADGPDSNGLPDDLAAAVGGELGGRTGIAPRLFLKKLVSDVLDRVDLFKDFNPRRDYHLTVSTDELTSAEREAHARTHRAPAGSVDEIELDL